jgi:hypothetical protein
VGSIYTREEIVAKIKKFDVSIEDQTFALQYSINSGQGSESVLRASITQLRKERDRWQSDLDALDGNPGIVSIQAGR